MINPSEVEKALIGLLSADATLTGLVPDGVYYDIAPQGKTKFVIVSLSSSRYLGEFHELDTFRALTYLVKAVMQGSSSQIAAADKRIQELLDQQLLTLPPAAGCSLMLMRWVDRVRYSETIAADIWQHRGARYEVTVTPE